MEFRTLNKAIYLILEKYHRTYGLKLAGFSGGHGYGYGMFYVDAVNPTSNGGIDMNYSEHTRSMDELALVFYLTSVGMPAGANKGKQLEMKDWSKSRTDTICKWLMEHLTLDACFNFHSRQISTWRSRYTVEQSEKYLLAMNVAGIYCAKKGKILMNLHSNFSEYDYEANNKADAVLRKLGLADSLGTVWGDCDLFIGTNGKALFNGERVIDFWEMCLEGKTSQQIVGEFLES
jgi:hypothetical protein